MLAAQQSESRGPVASRPAAPGSSADDVFLCEMQDNIVFGKAYEEQWYVRVVTACALSDDLAKLPWGDLTEIGERGVNLSGQLLVSCLLCLSSRQ